MILDTSALMAVVLGEPDAEFYLREMTRASELSVSAATLVEAFIVAEAKQGSEAVSDLKDLLEALNCDILPLTSEQAICAARAWSRFGKGRHAAQLNLGDCYSYATSHVTGRPLLYKGRDFSQTDVVSAMF